MMSIMAKTRRYVLQKLQLYFQHGFSRADSGTICNTKNVRIHSDRRFTKGCV